MKFGDFVPNNQKPKLQRLAKLTTATSASSYDGGCLWPNCNGDSIRAHALASFWMRAIETGCKVVDFYPSSREYLSRNVRCVTTPRGPRPIPLNPKRRDTEDAQRYRFLCQPHDGSFNYVDNLTKTRDYSLRNLNWAVYRSVLAKEWRVESLKRALAESGALDPYPHYSSRTNELRAGVYSMLDDSLRGLGYYKREFQQCLEPQNCRMCDGIQCSFVTHTILHLNGKPKLAASTFSLGIQGHENWGLSVVPLTDHNGHDVIWHHFGEHQKVMEERISLQRQAQGKKREEMVSQCILRFADALVVSPEWWDRIGDKRRSAIVEMISAETGIAIGTPEWVSSRVNRANAPILDLPNSRQLNIFRDA